MKNRPTPVLKPSLRRGLVLLGIWLCLARGDFGTAAIGLLPVVAATAISLRVLPPSRSEIRWRRLPAFLCRFGWTSFVAGLDVARRAVARPPDLRPDVLVVPLSLPTNRQRVLLANLVTLLPGTLAAELNGTELEVHALDCRRDIAAQVGSLEAQLFGLGIGAPDG